MRPNYEKPSQDEDLGAGSPEQMTLEAIVMEK